MTAMLGDEATIVAVYTIIADTVVACPADIYSRG